MSSSSAMSISNPFFLNSTPVPSPPIARHGAAVPLQMASIFRRTSAADGAVEKGEEEERSEQRGGEECAAGEEQQLLVVAKCVGAGQCCVANPFTQEDSCGGGQFERRMSQSSTAIIDSMLSEPLSSSSMIATSTQNSAAAATMLLDSGYRSTTSNYALDEELAIAVERERRAERRAQRRGQQQQQRRKNGDVGCISTHQNKSLSARAEAENSAASSVPAFLRRTCSTAASGFSAIKPSGWLGTMANSSASTEENASKRRKNGGVPRRTRSVVDSSAHSTVTSTTLPPAFLYSTGWMVEAELSSDDSNADKNDFTDCFVELEGSRKLGIQRLHELLLSRFCVITGMRTETGHPLAIFPDSRCGVSFENYQLLLDYLFQSLREEKTTSTEQQESEWVVVVDRRQDRWSSVKMMLSFLLSYFPEPIHFVLLLKPEGVLQRAIEYGYRGLFDGSDKFRVYVCQSCLELHELVSPASLTMDLDGEVEHNHAEWTSHRIDIERMKSSARVIAESLGDFGKCLRETELPNDVQTTERVLELQQHERDAIKEDFRISIRKGQQLLRQVHQADQQSSNEEQHISPCRLQNITAIERMIKQLQETEKSFDTFWYKHRKRLMGCLELRRFEDEFRKLQNSFAKHMLRLEEHREVGNSEASASRLALEHRKYRDDAMEDVFAARTHRERGLALAEKELTESLNTQGSDSVGPKCDELTRMADVLELALERRGRALELSVQMHAQIGKANDWCRRGVELLSIAPLDLLSASCSNNNSSKSAAFYEQSLVRLEEFISEGKDLRLDALMKAQHQKGDREGLMLLTSADTSSLLAQVNERIEDIRRLSLARKEALQKLSAEQQRTAVIHHQPRAGKEQKRPIQVVSPEKSSKKEGGGKQQQQHGTPHKGSSKYSSSCHAHQPQQQRQFNLQERKDCDHSSSAADSPPTTATVAQLSQRKNSESLNSCSPACSPTAGTMERSANGKVNFVLEELLSTERTYVRELAEIIRHYVQPFEALELAPSGAQVFSPQLLGQADVLFGNIRELHDFHHSLMLPDLQQNAKSVEGVSSVLSAQRPRLLSLYRLYCRNKPLSEALRGEYAMDQSKFLMDCQRRAGHLLPLSAYLLKPVQRITKYQLLLKELLRHCSDAGQSLHVQAALGSMLDLLTQINADMEQLHILGYPGDLRLLGALRLQTECEVFVFKRAKSASVGAGGGGGRRSGGTKGKQQRRHLLLFDGGVLFCKKRVQTAHPGGEYFEHKLCIPMHSLGFAECSRQSEERFELWDSSEGASSSCCCFAVQPLDERARPKWVQRLARLTVLHKQQQRLAEAAALGMADSLHLCSQQRGEEDSQNNNSSSRMRPQSWTTTSSSEDGGNAFCVQSGGHSAAQSSRSSTSSSALVNIAEMDRSSEAEKTFRRHSASSASSSSSPSSHEQEKNENEGDQTLVLRSQSQPPEQSNNPAEERQKKRRMKASAGGLQRTNRL